MLTIAVNVLAFYLGALSFGHSRFLASVTVFLVTGLVGTFVSTMIEVYIRSLLPLARPVRIIAARTTSPPAPKPSPSTAGSD